ncbi:histidine kinase [Streptomyces sp. MMG1121]|nr:histidine kinase [Streptomyces sp. MMG1121]
MTSLFSVRSVAGQAFVWQLAVLVLLAATAMVALLLKTAHDAQNDARHRSLAVAEGVAHSPGLVQALASPHPTTALQPLTEEARKGAGVDFVDVLSKTGIRYTDPLPRLIGRRAQGDIHRAAAGQAFTEVFKGRPQDAVRALVPVTDAHGTVVGIVSAGLQTVDVGAAVSRELPALFGAATAALALASGGAALVSRRLRRQTHGLGPEEMTRMYEHHDAVLHAVREGVLILDAERRLVLANDEAQRLLGLRPTGVGSPVDDLGLDRDMAALLASGQSATDEVHRAGSRLLAVNLRPAAVHSGPARFVVTLRDSTELLALTGRVEEARERLNLLYDAGARIGNSLDVMRTAQELADVVVPRLADFVSVNLLEEVLSGKEPAPGPVADPLLRRVAHRSVLADTSEAVTSVDDLDLVTENSPQARCLATGRSELHQVADAAIRAWVAEDPVRRAKAQEHGFHSWMEVPLTARGTTFGVVDFVRSRNPDPFGTDDLALAEELVARAAVCLDNARRYTHERTVALTLQHSLLPRRLPEQCAVEAAFRYLPADPRLGVGGDWFDVIPLSGARVALVVGDVVGHGIHAAATMGRLRSAMRTLADVDLAPDELLTQLDDIVIRLAMESEVDSDSDLTATGEVVATCLYAIYDPVSGSCAMARAGHPSPIVAHPDGTATVWDSPAGPPLGLGGLPFEASEVPLPEGSLLALYTDGLVESRQHGTAAGTEALERVLTTPGASLDALCDHVLEDMPADRVADDAVLLLARLQRLDSGRVATWDVPADPAAVAGVRADVLRRLAEWGLDEAAFVTELVVSELVTNAIRYGSAPIRLRLIRNRTLICEVSDGSSTAPHLRRARVFDEGGRGLLLVAQLTQRWGTRQTASGKTIWCEQAPRADVSLEV